MYDLRKIDSSGVTIDDFYDSFNQMVFRILSLMRSAHYISVAPKDIIVFLNNGQEALSKEMKDANSYDARLDNIFSGYKEDEFLTNLEFIRKYHILRYYSRFGLDISYYQANDLSDKEEEQKAMEHFIKDSAQEMNDHYSNIYSKIFNGAKKIATPEIIDPFQAYNITEIPTSDESQDLVEGILTSSSFNILSAPAKCGKSQLAYQLSFCLQNGIDFLGYKVKKSNVLYLDFEMSPNDISSRCDEFKAFFGKELKGFNIMSLCRTNYDIDAIVAQVTDFMEKNKSIDVIVWDNFYSIYDGNANDASEVKEALKKLQSVSKIATMILVCHTNKEVGTYGGSKNALYSVAGSAAFGNFTDEIISICKGNNGIKTITIDGRHIPEKIEIKCQHNKETNFCFKVIEGYKEKPRVTKEELMERYPEICAVIGEDGATLKQIQEIAPEENGKSLKDKGFLYSNANTNRLKSGFVSRRYYTENPFEN